MTIRKKLLRMFGICLIVAGIFFRLNYTVVRVDGISMMSTYRDGQILLGKKPRLIERDDVITFEYRGELRVKRVVGICGDKVEIRDNNVFINDKYVGGSNNIPLDDTDYYLHENEYFVLGDNFSVSNDSRMFGPIKREMIEAIIF